MLRARMGPGGFAVSRPGIDLNAAGETDLQFSSNTPMLKVSEAGISGLGRQVVPNMDTRFIYYEATINFTRYYPRPPIVIMNQRTPGGWGVLPVRVYSGKIFGRNDFWSFYLPNAWIVATKSQCLICTSRYSNLDAVISYVVFDITATV